MNKGFTLIEILVTLGVLVTLCSLTAFVSMEAFRTATMRSERTHLVTRLLHARAQAQHGTCDVPDCREPAPFTVTYGTATVTFAPYSAEASTTGPLVVSDGHGHDALVTVSEHGQITWTK